MDAVLLIFPFSNQPSSSIDQREPQSICTTHNSCLHFHSWVRSLNFLKISFAGKNTETSLVSIDFEAQALLIFLPSKYREIVSQRRSPSDLLQFTNPITENRNPLHASYTFLILEMETQEEFYFALSIFQYDP